MFTHSLSLFNDKKNIIELASIYYLIIENKNVTFDFIKIKTKLSKKKMEVNLNELLESEFIIKNEDGFYSINKDKKKAINTIPSVPIQFKDKNIIVDDSSLKIISHLNHISKRNFRLSKKTEQYIKKLLKEGFSEQDFFAVNKYFSILWNNPKMEKYIAPVTLYNSKFEDRVSQSEHFYLNYSKYKNEIEEYIAFYTKVYFDKFNIDYFFTIDDIEAVSFRFRNNSAQEDIKKVSSYILDRWGQRRENIQYIKPSVILNDKYESRLAVVNSSLSNESKYSFITDYLSRVKNRLPSCELLYDDFISKKEDDIEIIKYVFSNISAFNKYAYINPISVLEIIPFLEKRLVEILEIFLNKLYSERKRNSEFENKYTELFVSWLGGWEQFSVIEEYSIRKYTTSFAKQYFSN